VVEEGIIVFQNPWQIENDARFDRDRMMAEAVAARRFAEAEAGGGVPAFPVAGARRLRLSLGLALIGLGQRLAEPAAPAVQWAGPPAPPQVGPAC
jgi:hypothetical protein